MDHSLIDTKIIILQGPFAGFTGTIQHVDEAEVTVKLILFGQEREIKVPIASTSIPGEKLDLPPRSEKLKHLLEYELADKLDYWWLQYLDQPEEILAHEWSAFLQFRGLAENAHIARCAQLQEDFFANGLHIEDDNEALQEARWSSWLERWGLDKKESEASDLTELEIRSLKHLKIIEDASDLDFRKRWQETLAHLRELDTDTSAEEWAEIEAGWWEDFEAGYLSPERRLLLAIFWGVKDPSNFPTARDYRFKLQEAAEKRRQRAEYFYWRQEHMPPPEELAALRAQARQQAEVLRQPVQNFFRQVYHLELPAQVFTFWAFWLGLTPRERSAMTGYSADTQTSSPSVGLTPGGLFDYFEQGGLDLVPQAGLDHRLNARFYCDPPEFFTALYGDGDGLHFGLWYDNPHETFVASFYSRDGGGIAYSGQTLLEALREQVEWMEYHSDGYSELEEERRKHRLSVQLLRDAVMEYETADRSEQGEKYVFTYGQLEGERIPTYNELGVVVPSRYEQPLERDIDAIYKAIGSDSVEVKTWINEALQACEEGQPALALALGHDLHWLSQGKQEREAAASLLLTKAYEVLGYAEFAEIAPLRRDLPNVAIYSFNYDLSAGGH